MLSFPKPNGNYTSAMALSEQTIRLRLDFGIRLRLLLAITNQDKALIGGKKTLVCP